MTRPLNPQWPAGYLTSHRVFVILEVLEAEGKPQPDRFGGMAERTMAAVLKTAVGSVSPGVRIPLPPPAKRNGRRGDARVVDWGRLLSG